MKDERSQDNQDRLDQGSKIQANPAKQGQGTQDRPAR